LVVKIPRLPARRSSSTKRRRKRTTRSQHAVLLRRTTIVVVLVCLTGIVLGLAFAGSPTRLADGVRVDNVDVGGMTPGHATALLEHRWAGVENVPLEFRIGRQSWKFTARQLGVRPNWRGAVDALRRQGEGFGPFRGFRRLDLRFFGADVQPPAQVYDAALHYELTRIAREIDTQHREASIVLHGLEPTIVPGRPGRVLDRSAAAETIVRALASLSRQPAQLPVRMDPPHVTANDLTVIAAEVKTALASPIQLTLGSTTWKIGRSRIADLLELPAEGRRDLRVGGPGANDWFTKLERHVNKQPQDATWAISSQRITVVPDKDGYSLDVPRSAQALLHAALVTDPTLRSAKLVVQRVHANRTAAEAQAMHITGLVSSYTTLYGGDPNRIHNVQLVARLLDGHVIAPGETFSFNQATGARTAEKGFLTAPVIINGELQTGLGGGVCQVSTTVFNAAYEAGLPIAARTNHALYISHYPQGRDATVNYPDVDLKFVNDTGHWLLLRTWVGPSSLTVALYGTPVHRRVVSDVAPLVVVGKPPVKTVPDPTLSAGERIVQDPGDPARTTSVRRRVYSASGKLLYDNVFYSSYRAQPEVVLVGTKSPPQPKKKPKTTTTTTTTSTTTTTPR
jgi:vancomycin resistance protein YoaR